MSVSSSIFITVAYADVFDYPLLAEEVRRRMVGTSLRHIPPYIPGVIRVSYAGEMFFALAGRSRIVATRIRRRVESTPKWNTVRAVAQVFRWIPTVCLVGVTGGLSVDNARKNDDIDLFFVTKRGTLWSTRLLVTVVADLLRLRRRPNETVVANKICLNMFVSEDALTLPPEEQDLFAAHEVVQMVPLWDRGGAYRKFLKANAWVTYFLPNAWRERYQGVRIKYYGSVIHNTITQILRFLEPLARIFQLWYMQKHRTTEIISRGMLRFHPKDARIWVKKKFAKRLQKLDIPLDNVFYHR